MRALFHPLRLVAFIGALLLSCSAAFALGFGQEEFLPPEQAFRFSAKALDQRTAEVTFSVAPGYYLYREQFAIKADGATLGKPVYPKGKVKYDENFQKDVETLRGEVRIKVPVTKASGPFKLDVTSQGCADKGLCYPPMTSSARVSLKGFGGDGTVEIEATAPPPASSPITTSSAASATSSATPAPEADASAPARSLSGTLAWIAGAFQSHFMMPLEATLNSGQLLSVAMVFLFAGLLLSLTPCVLPMMPILSAIIVGHGVTTTRARGLLLATSYSLGMALVYTALGVAAGLAGEGLAAALQTPWLLGTFALLLAVLAMSMFGAYELRLPSSFDGKLTRLLYRLPAGRLVGVFVMGAVSALVVSPCVAAPLAGALVYISRTHDVLIGATALFSLAVGMSVPLLLVGASAGALLPKAGPWMEGLKRFFGVMLLAVAIWLAQPLLPAMATLLLWGALLMLTSVQFGLFNTGTRWPWRFLGGLALLAGMLQWVGAASGGGDPLQPLAHLVKRQGVILSSDHVTFKPIASVAELDAALKDAGRPVILDFYADWCVSCKEMERFTYADPEVARRMKGAVLLKADVTKNTPADRELLRRFGLFGPPGTIFFDKLGQEITHARVIGYQSASRFVVTLESAGL